MVEKFRKGFIRLDGFAADVLVSAEEVLGWGQLQMNAKYEGYLVDRSSVTRFEEVFDGLTRGDKPRFLLFTMWGDRALRINLPRGRSNSIGQPHLKYRYSFPADLSPQGWRAAPRERASSAK
jgi:hypothetical protein